LDWVDPAREPDPSTDLDWMLSSGQVSSQLLAESLVQAFSAPVFRLELFLLGSGRLAGRASIDTFTTALRSVYRYRGLVTPRAWLLRLAFETALRNKDNLASDPLDSLPLLPAPADELCQAFESLPESGQIILFLISALQVTISEISSILELDENEVENLAAQAKTELEAAAPHLDGQKLEKLLTAALEYRWPSPPLGKDELSQIAAEVESRVTRQAATQRKSTLLNEFLTVVFAALVIAVLFWAANQSQPERIENTPSPAQKALNSFLVREETHRTNIAYFVLDGDSLGSIATRTGTPIDQLILLNDLEDPNSLYPGQPLWILTPSVPLQTLPDRSLPAAEPVQALSLNSSPAIIEARLAESANRWRSLWADILYSPHSSLNAADPASLIRFQTWISQPNLSLEISGPPGRSPFFRHIGLNDKHYYASGSSVMYLDDASTSANPGLMSNDLLNSLFFPVKTVWNEAGAELTIVKTENQAGRETLVVDLGKPGEAPNTRLWVDTLTGLILRQRFYLRQRNQIESEIAIQSITLDIDLSPSLFDPGLPWQGGFAPGPQGNSSSK
jgi:DNA-directed RNA polymerase specialized sigma24 family protein/LysM repeat protein